MSLKILGDGFIAGLSVGFILMVFVFVGLPITTIVDTADFKKEAVKKGHAEWVMDPVTGETEWRWKEVQND